jgi:serine/threonine protein kinase
VAKLADFGCSTTLGDGGTVVLSEGKKGGKVVGTPYWMAPEVIKGSSLGRKSDIWSLGCTVLEASAGVPPYSYHENVYAALYEISTGTGGPRRPDGLSETANSFLDRCFERDPALRASADELLKHPWLLLSDEDNDIEG